MTTTDTPPTDVQATLVDLGAGQPPAEWELELDELARRAELVEIALRAAWPRPDAATAYSMRELPHDDLVDLAEAGAVPTFADLLSERIQQAGRVVDALLDQLTADPDGPAAGPPAQLVHVDTLRRWSVWTDQIVEQAAARRASAATGARHLADDIRREIAHPADQPGLAPALFRDDQLFDHDRTDPTIAAAVAGDGADA